VRPLRRVYDEPVGQLMELLEWRRAKRRPAAPPEEDREVREQERLHDGPRGLGASPAEPDLDDLVAEVPRLAFQLVALEGDAGLEPILRAGAGEEKQRPGRVPFPEARQGL